MKRRWHHRMWIVILTVVSMILSTAFSAQQIMCVNLKCEMLENPVGIDQRTPRLSWQINGDKRGIMQVSYHILVASSLEKLNNQVGDIWDSGKVMSGQSFAIQFGGEQLEADRSYFWKVKLETTQGETPWSEPAHWRMGLFVNNWLATWIGLDKSFSWDDADDQFSRLSARYFRKEFESRKKISKATVYIVGLGLYELYINGKQIGTQVLSPAPTDYTETVLYNTFDVTDVLKEGMNTIGTVLGNGRYFTMRQNFKPHKIHTFGFPKMLFQLNIEYEDGTKEFIVSDKSWKVTADGPIRSNNEYDGEEYDATKEMPGWNTVGFNDKQWFHVELVEEPGGKLKSQLTPAMKVMETIKPVSIKSIKPGEYVLDMGQNMAGWITMKVSGKRENKVRLRYAETLNADGTIYTANLRDAKVTDVYTLKGESEEVWHPSFVYHGFRYVEITGYPGTPLVSSFEGNVVYDALETIGSFETSDSTINRVYKNAYWGIRSNYKGMPVDCPQRNERQPWLGDRATGCYGESFIFDNKLLYAKWMNDIEDAQTAEGRIPDVAPNFWFYYKDNMTWPGTYLMIADMLYRQFGLVKPIEDHYRSMKQWLVYMQAKYMDDYIVTKDNYGDWCVPPESLELIHSNDPARKTDGKVIATAYYYYMLTLMQKFAHLLHKDKDIAPYAELAGKIKEVFNKEFFHKENSCYDNNTVTANLLPLAFGMVPSEFEQAVFKNIVNKIQIDNQGHISTGIIGTQWLMRTVTKYGRADLAFKLVSNRTYPSWGYMVDHGATTIWELWNGDTANPEMNSHNHVMLLGDLIVWFYENIGGIKSDTDHPGFKKIVMDPIQVDGLTFASVSFNSGYGLIRSSWRKKGNVFTWSITVPPNASAVVHLPAKSKKDIKEGGRKINESTSIKFLQRKDNKEILEIGSGHYEFETRL